jgi:hypothetical protein
MYSDYPGAFRSHAGQCMTKRDGSKARASAICIRGEHLPGLASDVALKNGCRVLISAAKPRDSNMLPEQG